MRLKTKRNLYIIEFNEYGYDQYDSFLVSANSQKECKEIVKKAHPPSNWSSVRWSGGFILTHIGKTDKAKDILMSSYNAG